MHRASILFFSPEDRVEIDPFSMQLGIIFASPSLVKRQLTQPEPARCHGKAAFLVITG